MSKEDKSIIPQPKCPVNFEILAANVQAVKENSKIGNRSTLNFAIENASKVTLATLNHIIY